MSNKLQRRTAADEHLELTSGIEDYSIDPKLMDDEQITRRDAGGAYRPNDYVTRELAPLGVVQ